MNTHQDQYAFLQGYNWNRLGFADGLNLRQLDTPVKRT